MGHLWSRRSESKASSGDVPSDRSRTARDEFVREEVDTSLPDNLTTTAPYSSPTLTRNEGYGQFLIALESLLTRSQAVQLATWFGYPPALIDKINNCENPSREFVRLMDEKGDISPIDISKLTITLEHEQISLAGVAVKVKEEFSNYRELIHPTTLNKAKAEFLTELRQKYENLYNAIQPIPYIRDRLFCVDKVFVEGGIEYLVSNHPKRPDECWEKLSSYKDIFHDVNIKSVRRILEGDPGYGKSTVALQVAYDWCNNIADSVSDDYEILILLRLKQLGDVRSILEAIKRFILPKDSSLNEAAIQQILKGSRSVLVILDGFDEYPDRECDVTTDISSIIKMDMFQTFDVVLTTRTACLPKDPAPQTKRMRLTGFDDRARDEYIRKGVVGDDEEAAIAIKRRLQENPILNDLCQVTLFFVMFAHMSHEGEHLEKCKSVTSFFCYMIECFRHHMKNKMKDENVQKYFSCEEDHTELAKVAFEGLSRKDQRLVWGKEELFERLGKNVYDHYVRLGILVEEDILEITPLSQSSGSSNFLEEKTVVRFYHKLFCEWYAAQYVSSYAAKSDVRFVGSSFAEKLYHKSLNRKDVGSILQGLNPFDLQYVFRFACGLDSEASRKLIKYLQNKASTRTFAVLCILEREGNTESILDSVRNMCTTVVKISKTDALLLQRSTIQLLHVATANEISISCLSLFNCYSTVDLLDGNYLQLKSNIFISVLSTLRKLMIDERGREITPEEFKGILQYSSKCLALKKLRFLYCLLPKSVQPESVSVLRSRNVNVRWRTLRFSTYHLNLQSCRWEGTEVLAGRVVTDKEYQTEVDCRRWKRT